MALKILAPLAALTIIFLAAPLPAEAGQPAKVPRIGYLLSRSPADAADITNAFRQGLRDLGYVEGETITIEEQWAEGRFEQLPRLAAELVRLKVDVIVANGEAAVRAAREATSTIPIVMASHPDPVGSGVISSLARPGGNLTGLSIFATDLSQKRLELLKEAVPKLSQATVLWNPDNSGKVLEFKETQAAARVLGVRLQSVEVRKANDFNMAFSAIVRKRPDALITFAESLTLIHRTRIVEFVTKNRLPMVAELRVFTDLGGLMSYGANQPDLSRRAATYVDKILKGRKPADLPVEQPTRFELVINMKTAKALGLAFPPSILVRADHMIE